MKFSLNWLQEFVDTGDLTPQQIGDSLTNHTCELEEIIFTKDNFEKVYAGKLISVEPHPKSDKLTVGQFDCGQQGKKQIVFGQVFELTVGEIYPVALDGAHLASGIEIKNSELKGIKSEGMVCTCPELGMKQETLLRFEEKDLGKSLSDIVPEWNDALFDIDNKSLTHRPDLMGHKGMARELSAIFQKPMYSFTLEALENNGTHYPVEILTPLCRRFCTAKIENVEIKPSDLRTQARLENLGVRAISNLVDLTNLSLTGYGQPMHVFDADKVNGKIIIRLATEGEKLVALDGEEYELQPTDIVIADEEKVLSIAGIMGGLESSVTHETKNILFESANFCAATIRRTSARLGLRSESSSRYEKSLDPEQCYNSIVTSIEKTLELCPQAKLVTAITDNYPVQAEEKLIDIQPELVRKLSGIEITDQEIINSLESLGFQVWEEDESENLIVTIPTWRATKDVSIAEDLIEEIVRLRGFDAVPSKLPTLPVRPPRRNKLRELEWQLRDQFAATGRNEVYLTSFVGPEDPQWIEADDHVAVQNGANEEYEILRKTLTSNAVRGMESELRSRGKLDLFEIGTVFEAIGQEQRHLLLFSAEMNGNAINKFYAQKTELNKVLRAFNVTAEFRACEKPCAYAHPAQCAEIIVNGKTIGQIAVLHPAKNPVRGAVVIYTEINLRQLEPTVSDTEIKHTPISTYPTVRRDLSIVVRDEIQQSEIISSAQKAAPELISIELFDVYVDEKKLGKGIKNLAFHLAFRATDHTLEDTEIDNAMTAITDTLANEFGAELRLAFDQKKA